MVWMNIIIVMILVVFAGTYAGLILALFSLHLTPLEAQMKAGNSRAKKVYPLRKKGNLLLCALLLGNCASYTIMAIYLGSITTGVIAGIVATSLIFVFGEILPQAVFPRFALAIGAKLNWLAWVTLVITYPVSAPIAWLLDKMLGKEAPVLWSKGELGEIIKLHKGSGEGVIDKDEARILLGALSFSDMKVKVAMIPREKVFFLEAATSLDAPMLETIKTKGHSRIPVLDRELKRVVGILYAKNLLGVDPGREAAELCVKENLIVVPETIKLDDLLNLLIRRKMHMALVTDEQGTFSGVATLEDIMEEILRTELEDKKA